MVVQDQELHLFISSWRDKLFSVQNTILELLEGLDKLETNKIIQTKEPNEEDDSEEPILVKEEEQELDEEMSGDQDENRGWTNSQGLVEVKMKEGDRVEEERAGEEEEISPDHLAQHFLQPNLPNLPGIDCRMDEGRLDNESSHYFSSTLNTPEGTDERRYRCDICDFSTKVKFSLNRHMKIHEDNQIQKSCEKCSYTTSRLDYMKRHMKKRHGYNTFIEEETVYPEPRVSRSQYYTGGAPVDFDKYSCNHCRYITTRIGDLKKHMSQEHPKENKSVQLKTSHHTNIIKTYK